MSIQSDLILPIALCLIALLVLLLVVGYVRWYRQKRRTRPIILPKRPSIPNNRPILRVDVDTSELTLPTTTHTGSPYYLVLDTETLNPIQCNEERIGDFYYSPPVALSWQLLDGFGNRVSEESYIINQSDEGMKLSPEATEIHGINEEMMLRGEDPSKVYERLQHALASAHCLVGHNLDFHLSVLGLDLRSKGHERLATTLEHKEHLCTMLWGQSLGFKRWRGGEALYPRVDELFGHLYFGRMHLPLSYRSKSLRDVRLCAACLRCKLKSH